MEAQSEVQLTVRLTTKLPDAFKVPGTPLVRSCIVPLVRLDWIVDGTGRGKERSVVEDCQSFVGSGSTEAV